MTIEQVEEMGRPARCLTGPGTGEEYDGDCREFLFENGYVWLLVLDHSHALSMRRPLRSEVPRYGWRHVEGCDCRHCRLS